MSRFSHISGHAALDLINTVGWRLSETDRQEGLETFADVLAWCVDSDLITSEEALIAGRAATDAAARRQRDLVVEFREVLYAALFDGDDAAGISLDQHIRAAFESARLEPSPTGWEWRERRFSLATPLHRIVRTAVELLQGQDLTRLHQCEDRHCGWVFIDTSRAHNRRWCVTKDCGDRNRSRAYYARQQARKQATQTPNK